MRLEKCWFCSSTVYPGHGICFVRNDSKTFRFCRSKCHKNFKLKRNPRKVKWTKAFRVLHGKDLSTDSVFKFERKRNRLGRYDRGITLSTLRAMKRVDEVRVRRAQRHFDRRMKGSSNGRLRVGKTRTWTADPHRSRIFDEENRPACCDWRKMWCQGFCICCPWQANGQTVQLRCFLWKEDFACRLVLSWQRSWTISFLYFITQQLLLNNLSPCKSVWSLVSTSERGSE